MTTPDTLTEIPLDRLVESPFNTRQIFAGLEELAASIRAEGRVHEPLLVRPRLASPVGDPDFELVFGHRRLRAAALAGLASVPCMVRAMSDAEARSANAAENLQRRDVHAFEEAEAYRMMIEAGDATREQIAERFGRSVSHVAGRLALLRAVPALREKCLAGEINPEAALLVARLRSDKLQEKALAAIAADYRARLDDGGRQSHRAIKALLNEKFALGLKGALFDTMDAVLLPEAGACTACPKRTGNAPEYDDIARTDTRGGRHHNEAWITHGGPEVCTDPECFEAKKKAHLALRVQELQAKGKTVVAGSAARAAVSATGEVKGAFVPLEAVRDQLKKHKGEKPAVVIIQDPRGGKTYQAVKRADAEAAGLKLKPAKVKEDHAALERRREADRARDVARVDAERAARLALLERVRAAAAERARDAFDLALVARAAWAGVEYFDRELLAGLWGVKGADALEKKLGQLDVADLTRLLLDCALVGQCGVRSHYEISIKPAALLAAAKHYGVPLDADAPTPEDVLAASAAQAAPRGKGGRKAKPAAAPAAATAVPDFSAGETAAVDALEEAGA